VVACYDDNLPATGSIESGKKGVVLFQGGIGRCCGIEDISTDKEYIDIFPGDQTMKIGKEGRELFVSFLIIKYVIQMPV